MSMHALDAASTTCPPTPFQSWHTIGTDTPRLRPYRSFPVGGWGLGMVEAKPCGISSAAGRPAASARPEEPSAERRVPLSDLPGRVVRRHPAWRASS
jgi:hypothetical protein